MRRLALTNPARERYSERVAGLAAEVGAAVHVNDLPGDVGGVIAGEKVDRAGDVMRATRTPGERRAHQRFLPLLGEAVAEELGVQNQAGRHHVGRDATRAELRRSLDPARRVLEDVLSSPGDHHMLAGLSHPRRNGEADAGHHNVSHRYSLDARVLATLRTSAGRPPPGTVIHVHARPDHPFFDSPTPLAIAHRGFSLNGLENSLAAFAAAVDLGYRYIETDARATRDGVVLAFHDSTLDRVTDRTGRVADMAWADVRGARIAGLEPIPRLEEVLHTWPDARVNLDVKDGATVAPLARVIDRAAAHDRVCVASFSDRRRRDVGRRISAPVATSAGRATIARFWATASIHAVAPLALRDVDCLQVPERVGRVPLVTDRTVAAVHAVGKQLHVWTINDERSMSRLLDLGVDGIMTDRADLLRDVMAGRGWS
jgi:glycerophosphoryl diester phosphodiesterase